MKRFMKTLILSLSIVALFSSVALANYSNNILYGGGSLTYGDNLNGNYIMAYAYYYHPTSFHYARAEAGLTSSDWYGANAGYTACANTPTVTYYANMSCHAEGKLGSQSQGLIGWVGK